MQGPEEFPKPTKRIFLPTNPIKVCLLENSTVYKAALMQNLQIHKIPIAHFESWQAFSEYEERALVLNPKLNPSPIIISDIFGMEWPLSGGSEVEAAVITLLNRQVRFQQAEIPLSLIIFNTSQPEGLDDAINLVPNGLLLPKADLRLQMLIQLALDKSPSRPQFLPLTDLMAKINIGNN